MKWQLRLLTSCAPPSSALGRKCACPTFIYSGLKLYSPHLRQLIYISLQSTEEPSAKDELDASIHASPSKIIKQQQLQMSSNHIPAQAVVSAQRVLMVYLHTNPPSTLSRALPQRKSPFVPGTDHSEGDSTVARRAAYLAQFRDCWELLSNDFSSRQSAAPSTPKVRSKAKRHSERIGASQIDATGLGSTSSLIVQECAWPLLEWLVTLFEHDENLSTCTSENFLGDLVL
jgi:hypothetical protein